MKEGEEAPGTEVVGMIARNPGRLGVLAGNEQKFGALVIVLNDLESRALLIEDAQGVREPD